MAYTFENESEDNSHSSDPRHELNTPKLYEFNDDLDFLGSSSESDDDFHIDDLKAQLTYLVRKSLSSKISMDNFLKIVAAEAGKTVDFNDVFGTEMSVNDMLSMFGVYSRVNEKIEKWAAYGIANRFDFEFSLLNFDRGMKRTSLSHILTKSQREGSDTQSITQELYKNSMVFKPIPDKAVDVAALTFDELDRRLDIVLMQVKDHRDPARKMVEIVRNDLFEERLRYSKFMHTKLSELSSTLEQERPVIVCIRYHLLLLVTGNISKKTHRLVVPLDNDKSYLSAEETKSLNVEYRFDIIAGDDASAFMFPTPRAMHAFQNIRRYTNEQDEVTSELKKERKFIDKMNEITNKREEAQLVGDQEQILKLDNEQQRLQGEKIKAQEKIILSQANKQRLQREAEERKIQSQANKARLQAEAEERRQRVEQARELKLKQIQALWETKEATQSKKREESITTLTPKVQTPNEQTAKPTNMDKDEMRKKREIALQQRQQEASEAFARRAAKAAAASLTPPKSPRSPNVKNISPKAPPNTPLKKEAISLPSFDPTVLKPPFSSTNE